MPSFELSFSWDRIAASNGPGAGRESALSLGFGTERLVQSAARVLDLPPGKAGEFCQFMPVWTDPAWRTIFLPDLSLIESFARDAWMNFQLEYQRTPSDLVVKDLDGRLPGISAYFEGLLLPMRLNVAALPSQVFEEQTRRAAWYRSPWAMGVGTVGLGVVATGAFFLRNHLPSTGAYPSQDRGSFSTPLPRNPDSPTPKVSMNPPVRMVKPGDARPQLAAPQGGGLTASLDAKRSRAHEKMPRIPKNAPHTLPSVAMMPPPSGETLLPPPAYRGSKPHADHDTGGRKPERNSVPVRRSMVAVRNGGKEAPADRYWQDPFADRHQWSAAKNAKSSAAGREIPDAVKEMIASGTFVPIEKAGKAPKGRKAKPEIRRANSDMLAAVPRGDVDRWSPSAFSLPERAPLPSIGERAKPRPRQVPVSAYRQTIEMDRAALGARQTPISDRIEGNGVRLNDILDRLTKDLNCSYILQPGLKTNLTVRLEVNGEPDEVLAQVLKVSGLAFKVNGKVIYIGQQEWLDQVFPNVKASLVITEPEQAKMDDAVDVAQKVSDGGVEVKRMGRYSVLTGSPEHLQLLLKSETLPGDMSVQALYDSHVPADHLLRQVPTSILAGNVMESFEDRSVRIQGTPTHVAAALKLISSFDKAQSADTAQLAMLREKKPIDQP